MALGTYGDLKTALANWLARSSLTDRIPDFVKLAETRIHYGSFETGFETPPLRIRQMETATDISVTDGEGDLPAGFLELGQLYRTGDNDEIHRITIVPEDWILAARENPRTGDPQIAAIQGTKVIAAPVSADGVTLTCRYWKAFDPLTNDADTNWLLQNAPQTYLAAALAEAFHYVRNLQEAQVWLQKYRGAVMALESADFDAQFSAAQWVVRPDQYTP